MIFVIKTTLSSYSGAVYSAIGTFQVFINSSFYSYQQWVQVREARGIPHVLVIAAAPGHYKIYSSQGAYLTFLQKLFEVFFGGQELGKKTYLFMQPRNVRRMRRRRGTIIHSILILAEGADSANSVLTWITLWVYSTHKVQVQVSELIST